MKKTLYFAALSLLCVFTFALSSCSKDDDNTSTMAKPVAALAEVGEENSKEATAGKDLHLEGDLEAEGLIARIDLKITTTDGNTTVLTKSWADGIYIGVRNTTFHEHVDIPATVAAGDYKLTFTVTDKTGQQTVFTSDLKIIVPVAGAPEASITKVGDNNSMKGVVGQNLPIEAHVTASKKIAKIEVELHNTAAKYEKVFEFTDDYVGQTETDFKENVLVPADAPAGEYHIHFTVTDAEGNSTTEEAEGVEIAAK